MEALETVLGGKWPRLAALLGAFTLSLWLLVPVHELLHVAGCVTTGGEVTVLELHPAFGGTLLARVIPWVVAGGDNAGRLSGFTPAGDVSYLVTVLMPYLVLAPLGAAAARWASSRRHAAALGAALAGAGQPLAGLFGDFYEAGAIPVTAVARATGATWATELRGDDLARAAAQATAIGAPAWSLLVAGLLTGLVAAAAVLWVSGGIAPGRPTRG